MVLSNSMFSFANNGITDNAGGQGNTSSAATGYLGTLKGLGGMGDLELCLDDIYELAYTKTFYIPNATVSDLN